MEAQNPWWVGELDYEYQKWESYKVKWVPDIVKRIDFQPYSLHFLVGPRQVGKTTALKLCIHELLEDRNPKSIFYYSCDELTDFRELGEILDNYLSARGEWEIKKSIIILDEITFVEDWWRAVKARIDRGIFQNDVLIITGSATLELLRQKEYFPGRRGQGKDFCFLPLDFGEYLTHFGDIETKRSSLNQLNQVKRNMKANAIYKDKIERLFQSYLKTGGFPIPIQELFGSGRISPGAKKTYLDWLRSDWSQIGKSDKYMKEVIAYLLKSRLSPISWLKISKETSINSPHTARSYVECLQDLFAVNVLHFMSPDFRIMRRKNKKVHISDPFLYSTLSYYTKEEVLEETIVESTVASHLSRVAETYYWRNGSEVDAVTVQNKTQTGFEVKWGFQTWRKPKHLQEALLLTKEKVPLFLSSVSWD